MILDRLLDNIISKIMISALDLVCMVDYSLISIGAAPSSKRNCDFTELIFFLSLSIEIVSAKSDYIFLPLPSDLPDASHKRAVTLHPAGNQTASRNYG